MLITAVDIPLFLNISRNNIIKGLATGAFSRKPTSLLSQVFLSKQTAALDNKYNLSPVHFV